MINHINYIDIARQIVDDCPIWSSLESDTAFCKYVEQSQHICLGLSEVEHVRSAIFLIEENRQLQLKNDMLNLRCDCAEDTCIAIAEIVGCDISNPNNFNGDELENAVRALKERVFEGYYQGLANKIPKTPFLTKPV